MNFEKTFSNVFRHACKIKSKILVLVSMLLTFTYRHHETSLYKGLTPFKQRKILIRLSNAPKIFVHKVNMEGMKIKPVILIRIAMCIEFWIQRWLRSAFTFVLFVVAESKTSALYVFYLFFFSNSSEVGLETIQCKSIINLGIEWGDLWKRIVRSRNICTHTKKKNKQKNISWSVQSSINSCVWTLNVNMQCKCATMVIETRIKKWVKIRFVHCIYKIVAENHFQIKN